jgi:hypothetical protein
MVSFDIKEIIVDQLRDGKALSVLEVDVGYRG